MSFPIWSVAKTCIRRAAAHGFLPRGFLLVIWVSFSNVAVGAVVVSLYLVATGEAVCVGVAPTGPSCLASGAAATGATATGAVVLVPPSLALRPLQLAGEFFYCGCEGQVCGGQLADGF